MIYPPAARRTGRRVLLGVLAFTALLANTTACSDDDSAATDSDATTSTRPTTTEPSEQAEASGVEDEIQALLHSYDELTSEIAADPEIASDPQDPMYDELRALMTPDSDMIGAVINALVSRGVRGVSQRAESDSVLSVERLIDGEIVTVSSDELRVPVCAHLNYGLFDSDDQQTALVEDRVEPAEATIIRVNDDLRIRRFDGVDDGDRCAEDQP